MKRVLVVEDNFPERKTLVEALKNGGFETLEAEDGKKGLEVALKEKPDLILLDLVMPEMSGLEMLGKLRAQEQGRDVQVVILTNYSDFGKIAEAVDKGICSYLMKSDFTNEDLVRKVGEFLK